MNALDKVAQSELDRVRGNYEEERRRRETELRERHQVVQLRRQMKEQSERWVNTPKYIKGFPFCPSSCAQNVNSPMSVRVRVRDRGRVKMGVNLTL